jgi:hypothetical protein
MVEDGTVTCYADALARGVVEPYVSYLKQFERQSEGSHSWRYLRCQRTHVAVTFTPHSVNNAYANIKTTIVGGCRNQFHEHFRAFRLEYFDGKQLDVFLSYNTRVFTSSNTIGISVAKFEKDLKAEVTCLERLADKSFIAPWLETLTRGVLTDDQQLAQFDPGCARTDARLQRIRQTGGDVRLHFDASTGTLEARRHYDGSDPFFLSYGVPNTPQDLPQMTFWNRKRAEEVACISAVLDAPARVDDSDDDTFSTDSSQENDAEDSLIHMYDTWCTAASRHSLRVKTLHCALQSMVDGPAKRQLTREYELVMKQAMCDVHNMSTVTSANVTKIVADFRRAEMNALDNIVCPCGTCGRRDPAVPL